MSRKHYTEVAAIICAEAGEHAEDSAATDALSGITRELALMFKRDNPRFDAGKFFSAAGFPELTGSRMGLN